MQHILIVGTGGFFGAAFRFFFSGLVHKTIPSSFPLGTLLVNISGCFIIGLLEGLAESHQMFSPNMRLFVMVGFLGGFTTFSSFSYETFSLASNFQGYKAFLNISLNLFFCLVGVWAGNMISKF